MADLMSLQQLASVQRNYCKRKIIINLDQTKYKVMDEVTTLLEWKVSSNENECHIFWKDTYVTDEEFRKLLPYQRINHFPGSYMLGRKNDLCRNLNRLRKQFPDEYDFYPKTWQLPYQSEEVRQRQGIYIVKPEANCQGRGIFLTRKLDPYLDKHYVVQEYLNNPYLIDGLKFDLRIYVLLKSVSPLKIFMYREGLARFSTKKYVKPHKKNMSSMTMHLTNYAINKKSKEFIFNKDDENDDVGHKRSFSSILKQLQDGGHDVQSLLKKIQSLIIKTFISVQPDLSHIYRSQQHNNEGIEQCFELFGFDVLLDANLKPWLLEVNHAPSFSIDTPLDKTIKKSLIFDTLILLDVRNKHKIQYLESKRSPIYQRPPKMNNETKETFQQKMSDYETNHLHGYLKIYPNEDAPNFERFLPKPEPTKMKEKEKTTISIPKRLTTNQSFSELDQQQVQSSYQLTSRNNAPTLPLRNQSAQRPKSSITTISRPPSGLRRPQQLQYTQQPVHLFQRNLQYPPPQEASQKPPLKMIQIKTFSFEKIDSQQKNE